ncbi:hypothetical protein NEIMUCOT_06614 [Neisseria mucosa ATCC 25996]|uniref:Uncharacterized protein n=1 Tax=Neisseria mucosa (strain ATCC 25996 / DSM 4631 / NCTC 10774 / M26) TaxID=546266 RepID=D3A123_NEIM2|nr:hypothetical protein NEIMUCOT_06614 [Neisseria mucosa ATCC 25996]
MKGRLKTLDWVFRRPFLMNQIEKAPFNSTFKMSTILWTKIQDPRNLNHIYPIKIKKQSSQYSNNVKR